MASADIDHSSRKKNKKKGKNSNIISFDEEIVPKHVAEQILLTDKYSKPDEKEEADLNQTKSVKKQKKKKKKLDAVSSTETDETKQEPSDGSQVKKVKKKKQQSVLHSEDIEVESSKDNEVEADTDSLPKKKKRKIILEQNEEAASPDGKKKLSIRQQKRQKYAKLLEDKKLNSELNMQQKSLNYLSKWKHGRQEWKFEKLRQIWLQQNMFDQDKIPEEFWATLVEYLSNARGKAREIILKDALKVVEAESLADGEESVKVQRARDLVQTLEE